MASTVACTACALTATLGAPSAAADTPQVVGAAATPNGQGVWMVTSAGAVAASGNATYYGSLAGEHLNRAIVGMAATPDGHGYWLVASDGGIFDFGDAHFYGSTGNVHLNQPIVGMAAAPGGVGYWLVAADGGIFDFGGAPFRGSAVNAGQRAVGMTVTSNGGYAVELADLQTLDFGTGAAAAPPTPAPVNTVPPPAPSPGSAAPSGESLPSTAPTGFKPEWSDDFLGSSLDTGAWYQYGGQPGSDPMAWWDPSHVSVSGGELHLSTSQAWDPGTDSMGWVSGGVGSDRPQTYGAFEVRMRVDSGPALSAIALLWPTKGWPPEVDFYEDAPTGTARDAMSATLHYGPDNSQIQEHLNGIDFTQWHTFGVEWTPGRLVYTVDGSVWGTVDSPEVPAVPMKLDLQTQVVPVSGLTAPMNPVVNMDVDWVAAYAMG